MASPGNRHCANCIGALSFPMGTVGVIPVHVYYEESLSIDEFYTSKARCSDGRNVTKIFCSGVNDPLPPEAKILKI